MQRFPSQVTGLTNGLSGELGDRYVEEHVRPGGLKRYDLRVDRRIGDLVTRFSHDEGRLVSKPVFEALDVIFAVIIVLIEDGNLRIGLGLKHVFGVDPRLGLIIGLKSDRPW